MLSRIDMQTLNAVQAAVRSDESFRKRIQRRIELIDGCELEEVRKLDRVLYATTCKAVFANSAMFFIYLVPFLTLYGLKEALRSFLATPEPEISKFIPDASPA